MIYLLCYALAICAVVYLRERTQKTDIVKFLVADRTVGGLIGSLSIAASWIWAPAIFVSSRVGYEWGYSGLVWFIIPNMLALVIFAPVAERLRNTLPEGYSYIEFLKGRGGYLRETQLTVQLLMQVVIYAIQLTAGADLLSKLTGAEYRSIALGMGIVPFTYTFFSGLRTSVFTDAIQYGVILTSAGLLLLAFPATFYAPDPRHFSPLDHDLLTNFGLSSALGLLVAIFADHQQWQRAFSIRAESIARTYYTAACLHGVVTLILGTLGCLVYREGFQTSGRLELALFDFVQLHYSPVYTAVFVILTLSALVSTLDSGLCAFSSLCLTELTTGKPKINRGRRSMFILALLGIFLSQRHLPLVTLWFIAGTIRLTTFFPTILSVLCKRYSPLVGTYSIIISLVVGGGVFGYGTWMGESAMRTTGMLLSISTSGIISILALCFTSTNPQYLIPVAPREPRDGQS